MRLNLMKKMMLYILAPTVLGLCVLAFVASMTATNSFREINDKQLMELVQVQAREINNIVMYIEGVTKSYGNMSTVQEFTKSYNEAPTVARTLELQKRANSFIKNISDTYRDVALGFIVDTKGIAIANSVSNLIGLDVSDFEVVRQGLTGKPSIEIRKTLQSGDLSAFIAAPIFVGGKVEGVFVLRLDLAAFNNATLGNLELTKNMTAYVYDQSFNVVMDNEAQYLGTNDAHLAHTTKMRNTQSGIVDIEFENVQSTGFYATVDAADWYVVIDIPNNELLAPIHALSYTIYGIAAIIIVVLCLIIFFVTRGISSHLRNASELATYVAAGNLELTPRQEEHVRIGAQKNDEIGALVRGLHTMIANLSKMVKEAEQATAEATRAVLQAETAQREANEAAEQAKEARREGLLDAAKQLEDVVNIVASASEELSVQIELSSNSVNDQAQRISTTSRAMEEMNITVMEVVANSGNSAQITEDTKIKAKTGAAITEKCKHSISSVQAESLKLRDNMNALSEHAQSINTVMSVITDIADQTNLLALNAAIEAARAGEAGRGFAVVADEVRKLAEKTITSTTDVANAISAIQASTESNVKQVDIAVQRIEEATGLANQSGEALRDILEMADLSAAGVSAIAAASEQQSISVREMTGSMDDINNIAMNTNNAMLEAADAVVSLSAQAQELRVIIDNLKK